MDSSLSNENTGNFHLQAGTKETYNRKLKNYEPICLVSLYTSLYILSLFLIVILSR